MPKPWCDSGSYTNEDCDQNKDEVVYERQGFYVVFTHDRELHNIDKVKIKISWFPAVVMRCKQISLQTMDVSL